MNTTYNKTAIPNRYTELLGYYQQLQEMKAALLASMQERFDTEGMGVEKYLDSCFSNAEQAVRIEMTNVMNWSITQMNEKAYAGKETA